MVHRAVEIVLQVLVGVWNFAAQAEAEIAAGEFAKPHTERFDGLRLLLTCLGPFFRDLRLRRGFYLRELCLPIGFDLLALHGLFGFGARFLIGEHLEPLHRVRDVADFVLAIEPRQHDAEIAGGDFDHPLLDLHQRARDTARYDQHHAGCQHDGRR